TAEWTRWPRPVLVNSAKARESVASLGTSCRLSKPHIRRNTTSSRSVSRSRFVVGKSRTALATKARAMPARETMGRPRICRYPGQTCFSICSTSSVLTTRLYPSLRGCSNAHSRRGNKLHCICDHISDIMWDIGFSCGSGFGNHYILQDALYLLLILNVTFAIGSVVY